MNLRPATQASVSAKRAVMVAKQVVSVLEAADRARVVRAMPTQGVSHARAAPRMPRLTGRALLRRSWGCTATLASSHSLPSTRPTPCSLHER